MINIVIKGRKMDKITQVKPSLYLGYGIHARFKTDDFEKLGIDVIINCCNEIRHKPNNNKKYIVEQYPIDDDGLDNSFVGYLEKIVDQINYYLNNGKKIYVHCVQGISRSAAIIIYYLMKYDKLSYDNAYVRLLLLRPCICLNENFVRELKNRDKFGSKDDEF